MVVQAVNRVALRKYEQFVAALETVRIALEETDAVLKAMKDTESNRAYGWKVPAKKEVTAARTKVAELLDGLRAEAKKFEKELIANGWRA